jgi:hypothetical protein
MYNQRMLKQNQVLEFTATPSFCNSWPEISVEANGVSLWQGTVDHRQRFCLPLFIQEHNQVYIRYLNKRKGPDVWDTVIDDAGAILQDQYCIISDICIGRSLCDFLVSQLIFYGINGSQESSRGFMSQQGHLLIEFPGDVYRWVLSQRQSQMLHTEQRSSALDYWNNYIIGADHADQGTINDIKKLLNYDKNTGN